MHHPIRTRRLGLTLIELLIVVAIIGMLGGIVGVIAPRFSERSRVAEASRQLRSWLLIAKQRAMRDKSPRGIRFLPPTVAANLPPYNNDPNQPRQFFYSNFAYVEQPEDITGQATEMPPPPPPNAGQTAPYNSDFRNHALNNQNLPPYVRQTFGQPDSWKRLLWLKGRNLTNVVFEGDVVEFGGARYQIVANPQTYPTQYDCYLVLHRRRDEFRADATSWATSPLPNYRITRRPQPIAGEPELALPRNVAVDIRVTDLQGNAEPFRRSIPCPDKVVYSNPILQQQIYQEIIFGPSGEVTGDLGKQYGQIALWLRDVTLGEPTTFGGMPPGENRLLVIHNRTGQVTAHPVDPTVDNSGNLSQQFQYIRDGKSSALDD